MCLDNIILGYIVKIYLRFVPGTGTLNCADYNGENSVVIASNVNKPMRILIKDDTMFYTRINSGKTKNTT